MNDTARWTTTLKAELAKVASGVLVISMASGAPAQAQTDTDLRVDLVQAARDTKATSQPVSDVSRVERVLNAFEHGRMRQLFSARDGFGVRIGGIEDGSGLAAGPRWRTSTLFGGNLVLHGSAVASIRRERALEMGWSIPKLGTDRLALAMDLSATHLSAERFYDARQVALPATAALFALDERLITGTLSLAATDWLQIASRLGQLDATSAALPGHTISTAAARGLGERPVFAVASLSATVDARDVPGNPRQGGRYHVAVTRFDDQRLDRYSFTRVDADVEQHVSAFKRQRLVTVRGLASFSQAAPGHEVPFFLQPTLGGSRLLRGFVTDRFRAPNVIVLQAEYGWDIWPFLSAVAFYETGTATAHWREAIGLHDLRRDYGLGFRFGSARQVALRTDVAFGSGEGTRISMRLNHAF